jgi:hypothetical protein
MEQEAKTMSYVETLKVEFPNAVMGAKLTGNVADELYHQEGFTPKNTVFGYSSCADEINRTVTRLSGYYNDGMDFPLGGLTGYPFRGVTGFSAFSHHIPDGGNLIILYGPHVGISESGELGRIRRRDQDHDTDACGSAIAFMKKYEDAKRYGKEFTPVSDPHDLEQGVVETKLMSKYEALKANHNPARALVESNYQIIEEELLEIVKTGEPNFNGKIALLGGVMINVGGGHPSFFDLRRLEVRQNGEVIKDLTSLV